MAEYSGRRDADGVTGRKGGPRFISRNSTKNSDQNIQLCNRIGCSGRLNSARVPRNLSVDKTKVFKPSSTCSMPGNGMAVTPSKLVRKITNPVKPLCGLRNRNNSLFVTASSASRSDSNSDMQEPKVAPSNSSPTALLDQMESQSGERSLMEISSPREEPKIRPKSTSLKKPASVVGSNVSSSRVSSGLKSAPRLSINNVSTTRTVSSYLRCSSVPVVAASDSSSSSRKPMLKKRSSEVESSSSSRAKHPSIAKNTRIPSLQNGISISETGEARRSQTSFVDNSSALVRARRSDASTSRRPPLMSHRESSADHRMQRLPYSLSSTGRSHRAHSFTRPNTAEISHDRNLVSFSDVGSSSALIDHEGFRHYNINGIAEVLLALEQIEHDEEISFEQLLSLESNVFLNGFSFHDQHRDMRLDIDGMSYEELLALEERMGSVSTALSEEALEKSINKSVYKHNSLDTSISQPNGIVDDTKCSICQEEYDTGDEMGRLKCKHSFHVECIDQWLRQKNWCPICKSAAAPVFIN